MTSQTPGGCSIHSIYADSMPLFTVFEFYCLLLIQERLELIGKQFEADKAKLEKIRLLLVSFFVLVIVNQNQIWLMMQMQLSVALPMQLQNKISFFLSSFSILFDNFLFTKARKNREISSLQRKIDEVPSRAELTQYQRRFLELYNHGLYLYFREFL